MEGRKARPIAIGLNAVIVAVTDEVPLMLTVRHIDKGQALPALPFGPLDPDGDRTLELGLRGWVRGQTGIELGYVEQLYTFGDRPLPRPEGSAGKNGRTLSIAYLALASVSARQSDGQALRHSW